MQIGGINFTKIESPRRHTGGRMLRAGTVVIGVKKDRVTISSDIAAMVGLKPGDRCDLYRSNGSSMWAIKPSPVGCLKLHSINPNSDNPTPSLIFRNRAAIREISAFTESRLFTAWVDCDTIIFRPGEEGQRYE